MIEEVRLDEVYWVLRANEPKNPGRLVMDILESRGFDVDKLPVDQYLCRLDEVKSYLENMAVRELVDCKPLLKDGQVVMDSYGVVNEYNLTAKGMMAKPPGIRWGRKI